jgi:phage terminase small subunit
MPRISAEAKSAAAFRAGIARRKPPRHLSAAAKRLWREIVEDRPVDYFRPGSYEALEQFCEYTIQLRGTLKVLRRASSEDYPRVLRSAARLSAVLAPLARRLRLSVQASSRYDASKTGERGDGARDRLLGGAAVWGGKTGTRN